MYKMIPPRAPPPSKSPVRMTDVLAAGAVLLLIGVTVMNVLANLEAAGAHPGFGFLVQEAGFDLSESLIPYTPNDTYAQVILAGLLNTVFLSAVCLVCSTVIGIGFGLLSVGPSPVGRLLALGYVDLFRNLPKLLVLLVLYATTVHALPHVREAVAIGPFHLSNRAINFPLPVWDTRMWVPVALLLAMASFAFFARCRDGSCAGLPWRLARGLAWLAVPVLPALSVWVLDIPMDFSFPEMHGFDFRGGGRISLQFAIVAATLSIYHGAQIAEVVRGGLEAVPKGQTEAAEALGLKGWQVARLVILPQVFRMIVPPINNQYVNLIKNTSIAIAIGYSDLMSVSGTIINQSFKPLEMMLITMAIYLAICLCVTSSLNRYHRYLTARESR